jgi:hypothetical protein
MEMVLVLEEVRQWCLCLCLLVNFLESKGMLKD